MKFTLYAAAASAALALAACSPSGTGQETGETDEAGTAATASDTAATAEASAQAPMPKDAQGFVDMAASSDMYEIEAGKLAQSMGKDQAVKDFGAMMVKDHTKSSADMKAAAGQAEGVTVAPKMMPKHQANLDALKNAKDDFDATYKQQQVMAHTEALALLQGYAQNGDAEPLKAFASKTAPVVQGHLEQARKLP